VQFNKQKNSSSGRLFKREVVIRQVQRTTTTRRRNWAFSEKCAL